MPETGATDWDRPKPPRFPWGPALLFAACVVAAGALWLRYSYSWDLDSSDIHLRDIWDEGAWPERAYGRLTGRPVEDHTDDGWQFVVTNPRDPLLEMTAVGDDPPPSVRADGLSRYVGRVESAPLFNGKYFFSNRGGILLETRASRFTPESVAALVVAAFGGFVFALHLRRWLLERKAHARGAGNAAV